MNVRYWQVHLLHEVDDPLGGAAFAEVIGVVAETEEDAVQTCTERLKGVEIISTKNVGHVRFIRHNMLGPNTKKFINGSEVSANNLPG
jgi:hypothetical protein